MDAKPHDNAPQAAPMLDRETLELARKLFQLVRAVDAERLAVPLPG